MLPSLTGLSTHLRADYLFKRKKSRGPGWKKISETAAVDENYFPFQFIIKRNPYLTIFEKKILFPSANFLTINTIRFADGFKTKHQNLFLK